MLGERLRISRAVSKGPAEKGPRSERASRTRVEPVQEPPRMDVRGR